MLDYRFGKKLYQQFVDKSAEKYQKKLHLAWDVQFKGANFYTGWEIEIGDDSTLGINCMVPYDLKVGKDVMIGPDVIIVGENHRYDRLDIPMHMQGYTTYPPVRIDDDVWIGARVIILPGVNIGRGAVIGAGSVVTQDVPCFAVCAGNPARVLKYRNQPVKPSMGGARERD